VIPGIAVEIGTEAAVLVSAEPLTVLSSAVVRGGLGRARSIVNLHVPKNDPCAEPDRMVAHYARRAGLPAPWVGLLTSARTEHAAVGEESGYGMQALVLATVGLSNRFTAGEGAVARWRPSTINTVVVVDAHPEPAALVNAVITATEVKALALAEAGIRGPRGRPVSGTSTDAVVIAATGRGVRASFGGPASELGWLVARAVKQALAAGIRGWQERNA
jgi:iron complex transport system ATP-binding protein